MRGPLQQHVTLWENMLADGILHCWAMFLLLSRARQASCGALEGEFYSIKTQCETIHQPSAINRNLEWISGQGNFSPSSPAVFIKIDLFALLRTKD